MQGCIHQIFDPTELVNTLNSKSITVMDKYWTNRGSENFNHDVMLILYRC